MVIMVVRKRKHKMYVKAGEKSYECVPVNTGVLGKLWLNITNIGYGIRNASS